MKILIIGSKGFIGEHCVEYFSQKHDVWQCDVAVDYKLEKYVQIDATNANYNELFQKNNYDICINCSGASSVPDSLIRPQRDFVLNTFNVYKQLDAIRKFNPNCKYINLSSAAVYGNPKQLPVSESHSLHPISPYGNHKKMAEDICFEFGDIYNLRTCSLRIFSAYGVGLQKQLFWDLNKKSKTGKLVELYGTGNESRDFINIIDLVNAIDVVINKSNFNNDVINVANGREIKIKSVVNYFYSLYDNRINYSFRGEGRSGDPVNWVADITKLKALGYKPGITIEDGLRKYYKWVQEND